MLSSRWVIKRSTTWRWRGEMIESRIDRSLMRTPATEARACVGNHPLDRFAPAYRDRGRDHAGSEAESWA